MSCSLASWPFRSGRSSLRRALTGFVVVALVVIAGAGPADATWSIVAVDTETGEVGVALASCVPAGILGDPTRPLVPVVVVPGRVGGVVQAQVNLDAPARIVELVEAGEEPAVILDELTSPDFDALASLRQYALVDLEGRVAAHTGDENSPVALDARADGVSVQGNLLRDRAVVDDTLARFEAERSDGADLADALALALAAGSDAGGDSRCPQESTALFAQLVVAAPTDGATAPSTLVTVLVAEGDTVNPVHRLAEAVAAGERGVIDLSGDTGRSGSVVRAIALVLGAAGLLVGLVVFRRGLGSVASRR